MEPGQTVGPYTILKPLGAGGMGEVYLCEDERLGRRVALKVVTAGHETDEDARRRLVREARTASALNHPHVCTIYDVGTEEGQVYIALEYIDGTRLGELIGDRGMPADTVVGYGIQIADALAHAHAASIVHCDLKSSNVMVTHEDRVKVLDFGLSAPIAGSELDRAQASQTTMEDAGKIAGTLPYMAPELLRGGRADERSDIWALSVLMHECLCGALPFAGATTFEVSSAILNEPPTPLPALVPGALRTIIGRCLAKNSAERYRAAIEVRAALEAIRSSETLSGGSSPRPGREGDNDPAVRSIAVLPLENLSGDPEQEYFSDGMTEALITELAKIRALKIISRTSIMRFKGTHDSLPKIATELAVDAIVEGSVFRVGDEVRITAQLIHAASDTHLWAESYDRDLRNILSLQKEVARDIVDAIQVALTPREEQELATATPVDPAVYEAILRGRFHIYKFSREGLEKGMQWLQRALELDPHSAAAHAYLAVVYVATGGWGDVRPLDVWPEAERLANRALELDASLPESRVVAASIKAFANRELDAAEQELREVIDESPGCVDAYYNLGIARTARGFFDEGLELLERAGELDPLSPTLLTDTALVLFFAGQPAGAEARIQTALEIDPEFWRASWLMATVLAWKGAFPEAIERARQAVAQSGGNVRSEANLAVILAMAGETDEARAVLAALLESGERRFLSPYAIAMVYAVLGELDSAFEWLHRGLQERDMFMVFLGVDPLFRDSLGGDPRYADLLARLNLTPPELAG